MLTNKLLILVSLFTFFLVNQASAQVETVLKPTDTLKKDRSNPSKEPAKGPMTKTDSMKAAYVNPGKVAGKKAVYRSMIIPGWGQVYNISLLKDGYGERAGKSQGLQKAYTIAKIGAIYTGFTLLTISYIDSRKNYNMFLEEAQFREANPGQQGSPQDPYPGLARYSDQGILTAKSTYKRNAQIVLFSYGLIYIANIIDAYVSARLHFFNIDDKLSFKVAPSVINTNNTMYSFNRAPSPALKLSLRF